MRGRKASKQESKKDRALSGFYWVLAAEKERQRHEDRMAAVESSVSGVGESGVV